MYQLIWQSIILTVKRETTTEHPDKAENLPEMNLSIDDLIFQLDLNKVLDHGMLSKNECCLAVG